MATAAPQIPFNSWDNFSLGTMGDSAEIRCGWCKRRGEFIYNLGQYDERFHPRNWKQLTAYEPSTIICNPCYNRGSPPHAKYLRHCRPEPHGGHNCFTEIGVNVERVAEFLDSVYTKYSPEQLARLRIDPTYNEDFPPSKRRSAEEMGRRRLYGLETVGQSIDIIYNCLTTTCPICDDDRPDEGCNHRKPPMLILGERGLTVSFEDSSPNLRQAGMSPFCLHTGIRSLKERVLDIYYGRGPDLFFELDMNSAWQAAGYADPEEPNAQRFMDLRYAQRQRFPRRDIYFIEPGIDNRFVHILSEFYAQHSILETPPLEPCQNCGRPINMRDYNNRTMICVVCNRNLMCMACANDGKDPLHAECYPCKFNYRGYYTRGSHELALSMEHDVVRSTNFHNERRTRDFYNAMSTLGTDRAS
jgi:hypothetical protein